MLCPCSDPAENEKSTSPRHEDNSCLLTSVYSARFYFRIAVMD